MPGTKELISGLFRAALNRDGQAPALEAAAAAPDGRPAGPGDDAADAPRPAPRRRRPRRQPREMVVESLAAKVLHGWLQNRYQTLYPLTLNFRSLRPEEVELIVHAMAAAVAADGRVERDGQGQVTGALSRLGAGAEARRLLTEAMDNPRPLSRLLADIDRARLGSHAYAASLLALNQRESVNRLYLDYLAARLALPNDVVASLDRRYRV